MSQERFYQLLSRKIASVATIKELEELDLLLKTNAEWKEWVIALSATPRPPEMHEDEADALYAIHATKMHLLNEGQESEILSHRRSSIRKFFTRTRIGWYSLAAVTLLAFLMLVLNLQKNEPDIKGITNEIVSKRGSRSAIKLPDGTKVWLNSDSKLTYAPDFAEKFREVSLIGEGYFDVVRDSSKPFIIHTDKINILVLGTAFNVKSYPQDDLIETSLIRGKIEVTHNDRPQEKVILKPNEKLIIRKNQDTEKNAADPLPKMQLTNIVPLKDQLVSETAWLDNKIAFSNESLKNISHMLERKFDVEFQFNDDEVENYTYTGVFDRESLEKILELISISESINYTIEGNQVTISK